MAEHRLLFFRGVEFHWFEFFAVGQAVWLVAEVGQDGCAGGELGLLDGPVRRDENVIRHLRVADRADEAAYILIAFCEAVLVLAPGLSIEHEHRRRAVEYVEEVTLFPNRGQLVVIVAPVPL